MQREDGVDGADDEDLTRHVPLSLPVGVFELVLFACCSPKRCCCCENRGPALGGFHALKVKHRLEVREWPASHTKNTLPNIAFTILFIGWCRVLLGWAMGIARFSHWGRIFALAVSAQWMAA
jgi:hypothetical protein